MTATGNDGTAASRDACPTRREGLGVLLMTLHQPVPAEMLRHRRTEIMVAGGEGQSVELWGRDNGHLIPCPGPRTPEEGVVER